MGEKITLTTPVKDYEIITFSMSITLKQVVIVFKNELNHAHTLVINGQEAVDMMKAINVANFSQKSLQRTLLEKLVLSGSLTGTISGSPDP